MSNLNNFQSQPHEKPLVERVHGTIATQLFESLSGAIGCNVFERKRVKDSDLSIEGLNRLLVDWYEYAKTVDRKQPLPPIEEFEQQLIEWQQRQIEKNSLTLEDLQVHLDAWNQWQLDRQQLSD